MYYCEKWGGFRSVIGAGGWRVRIVDGMGACRGNGRREAE